MTAFDISNEDDQSILEANLSDALTKYLPTVEVDLSLLAKLNTIYVFHIKTNEIKERIKNEQARIQKKMEEEFLKEMEKLRDRQLEIEEKKESDT